MRMRRQRVASRVQSETSAARHAEAKLDVGRFGLVELHVPVAVGRDGFNDLLAQCNLGERSAVWRERAGRERATAYYKVIGTNRNRVTAFIVEHIYFTGYLGGGRDLRWNICSM